ncbi:ANKRD32_6 [Blepharisma stoltei]|uniref:Uncharacterized protein n=1 Tax=Blepharisma stoltei TaxID=1481888 RepID=A0AAU9JNY2_9CILI|nr:unnamed protein product [Blepharisma stoltei]
MSRLKHDILEVLLPTSRSIRDLKLSKISRTSSVLPSLSARKERKKRGHSKSEGFNIYKTQEMNKSKAKGFSYKEIPEEDYQAEYIINENLAKNYNKKDGKYTSEFVGIVAIPRNTFQLASSIVENINEIKPQPNQKPHEEVKLPEASKYHLSQKIEFFKSINFTHHKSSSDAQIHRHAYNQDVKNFIRACKEGDETLVYTYLAKEKSLAYSYDLLNMTGLHWAVLRGNFDIMKILLDLPGLIDVVDHFKRTALHLASRTGNEKAIRMLVEHGANPNIYSEGNKLAIDLAKNENIRVNLRKYMKSLIWIITVLCFFPFFF